MIDPSDRPPEDGGEDGGPDQGLLKSPRDLAITAGALLVVVGGPVAFLLYLGRPRVAAWFVAGFVFLTVVTAYVLRVAVREGRRG